MRTKSEILSSIISHEGIITIHNGAVFGKLLQELMTTCEESKNNEPINDKLDKIIGLLENPKYRPLFPNGGGPY